jgi:hypothetical protein
MHVTFTWDTRDMADIFDISLLRRVIANFRDDVPSGWSELEEKVVSASLLEYSRADAGWREGVHSVSYQRESKRISQ